MSNRVSKNKITKSIARKSLTLLTSISATFETFRTKFTLPTEKWEEYIRCFSRIDVPTRTVLLREGEISRRTYLIEKGCLRVWFSNKGEEYTFQFFFENETVSAIESFKKNTPSLYSIETMEPCTLWWIEKTDLDRILAEVSGQADIREKIMDALFERTLNHTQHFLSFVRDTPLERYENLITQRPYIVQRVPQHYIASYLGISRVHLSRLRQKLARQKS